MARIDLRTGRLNTPATESLEVFEVKRDGIPS